MSHISEIPTCSLRQIHDLHIRLVPEVVDFGPEQGDTPSNLNETVPLLPFYSPVPSHSEPSSGIDVDGVGQDHLFGLVVIGYMSGRIDTSSEVSSSRAVSRSSGDEREEDVVVINGRGTEFYRYKELL